jgi:glutamine amidotransferase
MTQHSSVAVIDYGMGNLHSVAKALEHVQPGVDVRVTSDRQQILSADRVILPGVGAIRDCMAEIRRLQLDRVVAEVIAGGQPMLGICIGLQALVEHSEENGGVDCLGLLPGRVRFFGERLLDADRQRLKVPHMGWNEVRQSPHPMWSGIPQLSRFYFVHSYYLQEDDPRLVAGSCRYGVEFTAALGRDNVFAVQFHPEKSHTAGLQLLQNFLNWDGSGTSV